MVNSDQLEYTNCDISPSTWGRVVAVVGTFNGGDDNGVPPVGVVQLVWTNLGQTSNSSNISALLVCQSLHTSLSTFQAFLY